MVAIPTESLASSHSPTTARLSTPARPKGGRTDTSGAAQLLIMSKTRNILSVQTILVSIPGENTTVRKPHFSCSVFIGRQSGRSFQGYTWEVPPVCYLDPRDMDGTNFTVKDPPNFHSRLGKWHQGKSPPVHLFLTHWDHYVIKDACIGKSVGTPPGWRLHRRQAWVLLLLFWLKPWFIQSDHLIFFYLAGKMRAKIGFKSAWKVKVNILKRLRTVLLDIFYSETHSELVAETWLV